MATNQKEGHGIINTTNNAAENVGKTFPQTSTYQMEAEQIAADKILEDDRLHDDQSPENEDLMMGLDIPRGQPSFEDIAALQETFAVGVRGHILRETDQQPNVPEWPATKLVASDGHLEETDAPEANAGDGGAVEEEFVEVDKHAKDRDAFTVWRTNGFSWHAVIESVDQADGTGQIFGTLQMLALKDPDAKDVTQPAGDPDSPSLGKPYTVCLRVGQPTHDGRLTKRFPSASRAEKFFADLLESKTGIKWKGSFDKTFEAATQETAKSSAGFRLLRRSRWNLVESATPLIIKTNTPVDPFFKHAEDFEVVATYPNNVWHAVAATDDYGKPTDFAVMQVLKLRDTSAERQTTDSIESSKPFAVYLRSGRCGTVGERSTKRFESEAPAFAAFQKLFLGKTGNKWRGSLVATLSRFDSVPDMFVLLSEENWKEIERPVLSSTGEELPRAPPPPVMFDADDADGEIPYRNHPRSTKAAEEEAERLVKEWAARSPLRIASPSSAVVNHHPSSSASPPSQASPVVYTSNPTTLAAVDGGATSDTITQQLIGSHGLRTGLKDDPTSRQHPAHRQPVMATPEPRKPNFHATAQTPPPQAAKHARDIPRPPEAFTSKLAEDSLAPGGIEGRQLVAPNVSSREERDERPDHVPCKAVDPEFAEHADFDLVWNVDLVELAKPSQTRKSAIARHYRLQVANSKVGKESVLIIKTRRPGGKSQHNFKKYQNHATGTREFQRKFEEKTKNPWSGSEEATRETFKPHEGALLLLSMVPAGELAT